MVFAQSIKLANSQVSSTNILVLGDSISAGYGISKGDGWVDLLQKELRSKNKRITVINASISGETTYGGLSRIKQLNDLHQPFLLIIELGANDGLRGFSVELTKSNLQKIIDIAKNNQTKVLLVGMKIPSNYGPKYTEQIDQMYFDLAKTNKVTLIPFLLEQFALKKEYFQEDGIHPNKAAQELMKEVVKKKLIPLLTLNPNW